MVRLFVCGRPRSFNLSVFYLLSGNGAGGPKPGGQSSRLIRIRDSLSSKDHEYRNGFPTGRRYFTHVVRHAASDGS
jgi:hypothetical protein